MKIIIMSIKLFFISLLMLSMSSCGDDNIEPDPMLHEISDDDIFFHCFVNGDSLEISPGNSFVSEDFINDVYSIVGKVAFQDVEINLNFEVEDKNPVFEGGTFQVGPESDHEIAFKAGSQEWVTWADGGSGTIIIDQYIEVAEANYVRGSFEGMLGSFIDSTLVKVEGSFLAKDN